jgi:linoleoyl-CoA desaturase
MPDPRGEAFLRDVRNRVAEALAEDRGRGVWRLRAKAAIIGLLFLASYAATLAAPSTALYLAATTAFALASAALAFGVFHDANHGAFSRRASVNLWISRLCCAALGVGRHFWRFKHQVLHHHGPNLLGWDDDVESRGFLRVSPHQPWARRYRGQHLYVLPLYTLNSLEWIYFKDFAQYASGRINGHKAIPAMSRGEQGEFWTCKALYLSAIVLPQFLAQPPLRAALGFAVFHLVLSLPTTVVFQVAHLNDAVEFPAADETTRARGAPDAAHQMRTTSNFAMDDPVVGWFTGGLNFQIEHHLFPTLSHTLYRRISPIVQAAAQRHGLPYVAQPSLLAALRSHLRLLRTLSRPERASAGAPTRRLAPVAADPAA